MLEITQKQNISRIAIFIFAVSSLFYCYEFVVQVAPAAMTHSLMHDFSADATKLGLLASSFYWSYTLMQIPAGLMLDRYGSRLMLAGATLLCALGTLVFCVSPNLSTAIFGRVLIGISGTFAFTGVIYLIIRWFPPSALAMLVGILQMMASVGAIGGEAVLAKILHFYQWRLVMGIFSLAGFLLALIIWLCVRDGPTPKEKTQKQTITVRNALQTILKNPQTWLNGVYSFAIWGPIVAFAALWGIPFLSASLGISHDNAAAAISMIWIGIAVSGPVIGWVSNKIKRRCPPLTIAGLTGFIASSMVVYDSNLSIFSLYILLFLIGVAASGQTLVFAVVKDNNHVNTSSTANGFNNMVVVMGGIFLLPIIGKLLDLNWNGQMLKGARIYGLHNYHIALAIIPACFLISAITSLFFIKETYCQPKYKD